MKKKIIVTISIVLIAILIVLLCIGIKKHISSNATNLEKASGITVVATMNDELKADSSWCGTFQLVWNDMKNEIVKQDIVFSPQKDIVVNLNKEDFNEDMLSDEYYFKAYGLKTLELKEKIENGIMEKFNQTSDILDDFDWSDSGVDDPDNPDIRNYFFYTMLYRKFEFLKEFDTLDNATFADEYEDIEYFGIDSSTANSVGNQITVLYYNSEDDFAIIVNTKTDDEVIYCKCPKGSTFKEIYDNMNKKASAYAGNKSFNDVDEFKAPKLSIDVKKEYTELEDEPFETASGTTAVIDKALQTIKFTIDEKGGEIKSEAAIDMKNLSASIIVEEEKDEPRYFYVDDTFVLFLREKGKDMPYFACRVDDITKF